jgi:hypothetical protein
MFHICAIFRKFWLRKYDGGDVSSMEQSGRYSFWPILLQKSAAPMGARQSSG